MPDGLWVIGGRGGNATFPGAWGSPHTCILVTGKFYVISFQKDLKFDSCSLTHLSQQLLLMTHDQVLINNPYMFNAIPLTWAHGTV